MVTGPGGGAEVPVLQVDRRGGATGEKTKKRRKVSLVSVSVLCLGAALLALLLRRRGQLEWQPDLLDVDLPVPQARAVAEVLAAGVPPQDAEGVAALVEAVEARGPEPLSDPLMLLRFYRARSKEVGAAARMFRSTLDWRTAFPIHGVMSDFGGGAEYAEDGCRATDLSQWAYKAQPRTIAAQLGSRFSFFGRLPTHLTPDGTPVLLWRAGQADYTGFVREGLVDVLIQAFVVHLEDALQAARAASLQARQLKNGLLVIDASGFSTVNLLYVNVLRRVLVLCQEYYPEVMASIVIVRAPWAFAQFFELMRPWLTPVMRRKITILAGDFERGLRNQFGLDSSMLPEFLGGNVSDATLGVSVEPVPAGVGRLLPHES